MKKLTILILFGLASSSTFAADIEAGKAKAAICASCHGADGVAIIPTYPNLKGQNAAYLEKSIKAFKSGERKDPVMSPMAATINDADIENIAAYFESLK
ncbi:c-type cytochrome [Vibrio rumoiensis]|uniref:Cytochrome C n=1 Tax=Vibrio rumoiensis 1S-45 TaxID=1188252 RepID=A0A1E5E6N2_9VIBR|nr:cytochrome c [Vibrio rumoiensis]OEF30185.1 cytochrome C [Vibrio rumoiensis 1S-45]